MRRVHRVLCDMTSLVVLATCLSGTRGDFPQHDRLFHTCRCGPRLPLTLVAVQLVQRGV